MRKPRTSPVLLRCPIQDTISYNDILLSDSYLYLNAYTIQNEELTKYKEYPPQPILPIEIASEVVRELKREHREL